MANVPKSLDQNDEVDPEPVTIRHADYENCSFRVVPGSVRLKDLNALRQRTCFRRSPASNGGNGACSIGEGRRSRLKNNGRLDLVQPTAFHGRDAIKAGPA